MYLIRYNLHQYSPNTWISLKVYVLCLYEDWVYVSTFRFILIILFSPGGFKLSLVYNAITLYTYFFASKMHLQKENILWFQTLVSMPMPRVNFYLIPGLGKAEQYCVHMLSRLYSTPGASLASVEVFDNSLSVTTFSVPTNKNTHGKSQRWGTLIYLFIFGR